MLAELAAANAAYATISKFIANGKEISDALQPLKNLVGAEEELRARGCPLHNNNLRVSGTESVGCL